MSNVNVLTLDRSQIDLLLSNHELFTDSEVKLAAKRKIELDKQDARSLRILELEHQNQLAKASYNHVLENSSYYFSQPSILDELIGNSRYF